LTKLFNDIAHGTLDEECAALLLAGRGLPLGKKDGGLRPIAITEAFYRIVASWSVRSVSTDMGKKLVLNGQYAIGVQGGASTMLHALQVAMANPRVKRALVMLDFKNAFGELFHQVFLAALASFEECKSILPLAFWAYQHASVVFVQ